MTSESLSVIMWLHVFFTWILLPSVIIQLHVKLLSLSYDLLRISMRLEGVVLIEPHLIGYSSFTGSAYFKGVAQGPPQVPRKEERAQFWID